MKKNALVLSGGSIKGAFEAGAVQAIIEKGFHPHYLFGISVGSLNTTFINHQAGLQNVDYTQLDWEKIKNNLMGFWTNEIREPGALVKKHNVIKLLFQIVFGKFDGLTTTQPLRDMVHRVIKLDVLRKSPLQQHVGATNIVNGQIVYADPSLDDFLDYVIASTAIPMAMPAMMIKDIPYFDGGLRDVAPLKKAILSGAQNIICVLCQPEKLSGGSFNHRSFTQLLMRMTDVMIDEIEQNDIDLTFKINKFVPADGSRATGGPYDGKRKINLLVIRPDCEITVDITKFTPTDIRYMIDLGYEKAKERLAGYTF
ncbi:MAG: patatin-like phospholipase family protein [Bacteroidetes bacterium]|nr:patatin-like phospholipase family protein [Bacteroidota bacterium]